MSRVARPFASQTRLGVANTAAGLSFAVLACASACLDGMGPRPQPSPLVVSDTASGVLAAASNTTLSPSGPSQTDLAYISLPPGTSLDGDVATIRNTRTGGVATVPLYAGGFDPVPMGAAVRDTIAVLVRDASSRIVFEEQLTVATRRRPVVVRTDPPPRKRDVPLNVSIVVVFSEPIDASTLTSTSFQLLRGLIPVPGRLQFVDSSGLTVAFTPSAPLAASTAHTLVVTEQVLDLDGESLETAVAVPFTTGTQQLEGQIAFSGWRYGEGWDIYVMNADASEVKRLTNLGPDNYHPAVSPVGTRIAFINGGTYGYLHTVNIDGSGLTRLATDSVIDGFVGTPAWSPDGTKIAFSGERCATSCEVYIWVMNADGSGVSQLTSQNPWPEGRDIWPTWSPDGSKIAFTRYNSGDASGIYIINADGSGASTLLVAGAYFEPAWSPDRSRIAAYNLNGQSIDVVDLAGPGVTRLPNTHLAPLWQCGGPTWSPGGSLIAFTGRVTVLDTGNPMVDVLKTFVLNADGSGMIILDQENACGPFWFAPR